MIIRYITILTLIFIGIFAYSQEKISFKEFDEFFESDSLYNEQRILKSNQGKLSDCEYGIKLAQNNFIGNIFVVHSNSFSGNCSYCEVLRIDL